MRNLRLGALATILMVLGFATPAFAESETLSPWWQLSSSARPTNLRSEPGLSPGHSEVQELLAAPGAVFELQVGGKKVGEVPGFPVAPGFFEAEPYPGPFGGRPRWPARQIFRCPWKPCMARATWSWKEVPAGSN